MVTDQNQGLDGSWGIGWMVKKASFGKRCSARTFGHSGSTGGIAWADPERDLICVLLTSKPLSESKATLVMPVCDVVSEA